MNPPYLRTVHTWTTPDGTERAIDDEGYPQRPGLKEAVLRAWAALPKGGTYRAEERES